MFSEEEIRQRLNPMLRAYSLYITAIANILATDDAMRANVLDAVSAISNFSQTAEAFRQNILGYFSIELSERLIAEIMQLAIPTAAGAPAHAAPARAGEPEIVRAHRTPERIAMGARLAERAEAMLGWFHWGTSKGFRSAGPDAVQGTVCLPNTRVQLADGRDARDGFIAWLFDGEREPDAGSAMNCWEAVLFTAVCCGATNKAALQQLHRAAAQDSGAFYCAGARNPGSLRRPNDAVLDSYYSGLIMKLGFVRSQPYDPDSGRLPQAGDIICWGGFLHVAVSLGRSQQGGASVDYCMSLWTDENGSFARKSIAALSQSVGRRLAVRYIPCPFPLS